MRNLPLVILILVLVLSLFGSSFIVNPGERGVRVTLGSMSNEALKPGVGLKWPWISSVTMVNVQQATAELTADCFSSDLQQVAVKLKVLYRIPETGVVRIVRDYAGEPFNSLILPRVQEAIKEVTAAKTAAEIVKTREQIKLAALDASRKKIGEILTVSDLVIEDVKLSPDLERAIEAKMVQEQEAEKAVYREQQAQTEAKIAVAKARGEAEAITVQGAALEKAPQLIFLKLVEKWNGVAPQVMGGNPSTLLSLSPKAMQAAPTPGPGAAPAPQAGQ